MSFESKLRPES